MVWTSFSCCQTNLCRLLFFLFTPLVRRKVAPFCFGFRDVFVPFTNFSSPVLLEIEIPLRLCFVQVVVILDPHPSVVEFAQRREVQVDLEYFVTG